jgi:hypothetical protein
MRYLNFIPALVLLLTAVVAHPQTPSATPAQQAGPGVEYKNKQYEFCFSLPASWKSYSIVTDQWRGTAVNGPHPGQVIARGPIISIRHPLWTAQNPRQDIPIMVFTLKQWKSLEKEDFVVSAAPIGPRELGRNRDYVFALPPRFDFAAFTGVEEVDQIVNGTPLKTPCKVK